MAPVLRCALTIVLLLVPARAWSQQMGMTRALDLERRGDYAGAAAAYRAVLADKPADVSALLGLERSLLPLNRSADMLAAVRAALAAAPSSSAVYGVALRSWAAAGQPDSVRSTAERWARVAPTEEAPYREWGAAELGQQNRAGARAAYLRGRARLGRPDALAAELAQLALAEGDYATALREWLQAVRRLPGYRVTAVASLAQARDAARSDLLRLLARESDLISRRVEADLRARWGDPVGGFRVLGAALPSERVQAIAALRGLLDQLRTIRTQAAKQTEGMVLEAIAARSPEVQASRLRLEAAQAYTAAGDRAAAHRMLGGLNDDRPPSRSVASDAATTHVEMLISGGKLEDATTRLAELRANLSADDYDAIRRRIALGWMKQGNLEHADSAIAGDKSVEGLALSGQIKLYRGDIGGAVELFMAAGPYAGDRAQATHRTTLLALLQPLERDSMPDLGRAFLQLDQGDTTQAIAGLAGVAPGLPASHGGAALYLLAGRLSAATGKREEAESLFRTAAAKEAPATAPAAELALAELLISDRRGADAIPILEHLILTYPQSAVVPQARRKLDEARGAVPKT